MTMYDSVFNIRARIDVALNCGQMLLLRLHAEACYSAVCMLMQ